MKIYSKWLLAALLPLTAGAAAAQTTGYIGFAPNECAETEISAQGTGKNQYIEVAIKLDPETTPYFASMAGCQIVGVRCYLRADYKQKGKGYSTVNLYSGSLTAEPVRRTVNFTQGWNEVMFDEPYTIGTDPVYVGYRVFELMGPQALPIVSYRAASVTGGYYVSVNRSAWEECTDRGTLMVQAIVSAPDGSVFSASGAVAHPMGYPRIVAPDEAFDGAFYVHNFSSEPMTSLVVNSETTGHSYPLELPEPLAGYGSVRVAAEIQTGSQEGVDVPLTFSVSEVNGKAVTPAHYSTAHLYVSADNFVRIPLVEEYTSLYCVNCPFMAYFLEKARERFEFPHVFVAHHSGFRYDDFTQPVDKELEYLFFGTSGNPFATYDRTILDGQTRIMIGAKTADVEPYTELLTQAVNLPALASVKVEMMKDENNSFTARVSGRIASGEKIADGKVYLSAYVVEDNIARGTEYEQSGVDYDLDPDSPADLFDTYRHNGVIRKNLCTEALGDLVATEADGTYSVTYPAFKLAKGWVPENCHVVAFLHRINKADMRDNFVLNAGDSKPLGESASITEVETGADALRYTVTADRRIIVTTAARSVNVYSAQGVMMPAEAQLTPGVYILRVVLPSGKQASRKVAVI